MEAVEGHRQHRHPRTLEAAAHPNAAFRVQHLSSPSEIQLMEEMASLKRKQLAEIERQQQTALLACLVQEQMQYLGFPLNYEYLLNAGKHLVAAQQEEQGEQPRSRPPSPETATSPSPPAEPLDLSLRAAASAAPGAGRACPPPEIPILCGVDVRAAAIHVCRLFRFPRHVTQVLLVPAVLFAVPVGRRALSQSSRCAVAATPATPTARVPSS